MSDVLSVENKPSGTSPQTLEDRYRVTITDVEKGTTETRYLTREEVVSLVGEKIGKIVEVLLWATSLSLDEKIRNGGYDVDVIELLERITNIGGILKISIPRIALLISRANEVRKYEYSDPFLEKVWRTINWFMFFGYVDGFYGGGCVEFVSREIDWKNIKIREEEVSICS